MKRELDVLSVITLRKGDTETQFHIDSVIGVGGSCIAYEVSFTEDGDIVHKGVLKELCPAYLDGGFTRQNGAVVADAAHAERFSEDVRRFKKAYRDINAYLSQNASASNYHPVQLGMYEGGNTVYTLTSRDYGKSYDMVDDRDLHTLLRRIAALTTAVGMYHEAGFLHLDIKPKNVLILEGASDIVKLFDYDSLTPVGELKRGRQTVIPAPEDYYVPELHNANIRAIGAHTDVFEIGAMLFLRIFGRPPRTDEIQRGARIEFDGVPMLTGISPQALYSLSRLFEKTLQVSPRLRYSSINELLAHLLSLTEAVADSRTPYLLNLPVWQPSRMRVGREKELTEIKARLERDGYVFIKGIGGIGKSELAKLFAGQYGDGFHTVQFCKYTDSLKTLVAAMPVNGINDGDYTDHERLVKEKNKVLHTADEHTLIIVDNFNVTHDRFLRDFLPADNRSFKVIFTTRCTPDADYYADRVYTLGQLSEDECLALYSMHTGKDIAYDTQPVVRDIIRAVERNTLCLVLAAAAVKKSGISEAQMLEKLTTQTLDDIDQELFHEYDYDADEYTRINAHLRAVFSVSRLAEYEKEILKDLTLIDYGGITVSDFTECCDSADITAQRIDTLAANGWVDKSDDGVLRLHPIVSDLIWADDSIPKSKSYYALADALESYCDAENGSHISEINYRLGIAVHLDRRSKNESVERRVGVKLTLANMYAGAYRTEDARRTYPQALELAKRSSAYGYTPIVYYYMGEFEKSYGSRTASIKCYELAIDYEKRHSDVDHKLIVTCLIETAECYLSNENTAEAYKKYKQAYRYAKFHSCKEELYEICSNMADCCAAMGRSAREYKYRCLADKYSEYRHGADSENPFEDIDKLISSGNVRDAVNKYEEFLADYREKLGEDSPAYKDIAQSRWMYYVIAGEAEQGRRMALEHLEFVRTTYGEQSMEMARHLTSVADVFGNLYDFELAVDCAKKAVAICRARGEEKSYTEFEARLILAKLYTLQGDADRAKGITATLNVNDFSSNEAFFDYAGSVGLTMCEISEYDRALELCRKVMSKPNVPEHVKTQMTVIAVIACEQTGHLDQAMEFNEAVQAELDGFKLPGVRNELIVQYYRAVARIAHRKGDNAQAVKTIDTLFEKLTDNIAPILTVSALVERGLYLSELGEIELAGRDFDNCEKILTESNAPGQMFVTLYNNMSLLFINSGDCARAKLYLDRVVSIRPSVLTPDSLTDAVICGNFGRVALELGDTAAAEKHILASKAALERIGCVQTADYMMALFNVLCLYRAQKRYDRAVGALEAMLELYDASKDVSGRLLILYVTEGLGCYLDGDRPEDAYHFATREQSRFTELFGYGSEQRMTVLLSFGGLFKQSEFVECREFFAMAYEVTERGYHKNTVYEARLYNYLGVCYMDIDGDWENAYEYCRRAKDMFEALGAEDDIVYPYAVTNMQTAAENKWGIEE